MHPHPSKAKEIASNVPIHFHHDWHHIKLTVMREILHAKADCCPLFKTELMESQGNHRVESTHDLFWASGLPPSFTVTTKPDYYPGGNQLGHILESVRNYLIKESVVNALIDTDSQIDLLFPQYYPQDDLDFPPPPPPQSCTANDHTLDDSTDQSLLPLPPSPSSPLHISYLPTMTHTSLSLASPSPRPSTSTTPYTEFT